MKRFLASLAFACVASIFLPLGCGGATTCAAHEDCETGELCVFSTGKCAAKCEPGASDTCPSGATCEPCTTTSSPTSDECLPACFTPEPASGDGDPGGW